MKRFSFTRIACLAAIALLTAAGGSAAHAKTYTLILGGASNGVTERSIGATEGCSRFVIDELVGAGLSNYRIWVGMSRLEPEDDDGVYGRPTIEELKADPELTPNLINWSAWDRQFNRLDSYHFSPGCTSTTPISLHGMLAALRDKHIAPVLTLRNVDDNGLPLWAERLNPPRTIEDWNEWWEHVFATVYWVNVRNGLEVHDWQVHNEPDSFRQGWEGTLQDYLLFTRYTRDAIQFVYDNYLPGRTFRVYAPVTTGLNSWVEESLLENDDVIDVVDWHNYSSSHYADAVQTNEWIDLYDRDGKHEDTYISEWGSYRSAYGSGNALSYAKILIEHSRDNAGYVTGSAIFPFYDWQTMGGIVHGDGTKTPTYYALRLMTRGLQGGKTRFPITHNIPSTVDVQPIAAVDEESKTLNVEVVNKTRTGHTILLDAGALLSAGTATLRRFSEGVNDEPIGPAVFNNGQTQFELPALSIIQVSMPLGNPPPLGSTMRVSAIAMSYQLQGKNCRATATVTIGDPNGNDTPLAGATVHGVYTGLSNDSVSGMTNSSGQVTLTSSSTKQSGTWEFCVTDVVRADWTYKPFTNLETCDTISTP